ncbi:CRT10-domain-containing protein [Triangularia verruculosa]|uniref:CRT10-domain-containing protein n=1 Tax=Triangularia verruculosa TaxID=2587418 RepID=A0AAN7AZ04_9PEZI|nr:CRT10-domain-containing protein [Triangularia verruculosa]
MMNDVGMETTQQPVEAGYEEVHVHPVCHVQTPENRFGPGIRESFAAHVNILNMGAVDDFDDEDDEDSDEMDAEDEDDNDTDDDGEPVYLSLGAWLLGAGMTAGLSELDGPAFSSLFGDANAANAFPQTSTGRCNLTALSQRYNLYFAAYQDKIHVYQPQRAPRILPPPCLVLHPGPTMLARLYPGELDRRFSHQINNMIVGNLGNLEIVLFAFDDGDVGAYYTHTLVHWIKTFPKQDGTGPSPRHSPRPKMFFHENVSLSAWGLAIHQQSCLIAVGSNRHEVTVFAFALPRQEGVDAVDEKDESPEIWTGQTALQLQKHLQSRTRTWKITLPLATSGHNIPSLSFLDDEHGNADKVAAIDIWGVVWLLDIWKIGTEPITVPVTLDMNRYVRGWSVMVFPDSAFKPTKSLREALGVPGKEIILPPKSSLLDITCGLYYVKDLAVNVNEMLRSRPYSNLYERTHQGGFGFGKDTPSYVEESNPPSSSDWESVSGDSDSDEDSSLNPNMTVNSSVDSTPFDQRWGQILGKTNSRSSQIKDFSDEVQLRREIIPVFGETPDPGKPPLLNTAYSRMCAERQKKVGMTKVDDIEPHRELPKDYCIMRTSAADVELVPFDRKARRLTFKHILTFLQPQPGQVPLHHAFHTYSQMRTERVHLMLHVPELFLVVLGSEVGRVALVTLTKTSKSVYGAPVRRGFRVDCVLPRRAEEQKRMRPFCGLVGMAISPEPAQGPKTKGQLELCPPGVTRRGPVVYRLILHYADHTILMYDLARGRDEEDELVIF